MKTYKSYQEAKLAMPLACIIHDTDNNRFFGMPSREGTILTNDGCKFANPIDHLQTVYDFLSEGNRFVFGDIYVNESGRVFTVDANILNYNSLASYSSTTCVLRAAALEDQMNIDKLETQTEEELIEGPQQGEVWRCVLLPRQYVIYLYKSHKGWDIDWANRELLEGQEIKPIQKLYTQSEVKAFPVNSEGVSEWSNGDECLYMNSSEVHKFIGIDPTRNNFCYIKANCSAVNWVEIAKLSKPETPEAKEQSERDEMAKQIMIDLCYGDIVYDPDGNEIKIINANMIYGLDGSGTFDYWDRADLTKTKPESPDEKQKREWIDSFASEIKNIGTTTYKEILGRMYDSLK